MIYKEIPPTTDFELQAWASNMATLLTDTPAPFGVTPAQATELASRLSDYSTKLQICKAPETRTKLAVGAKDVSKQNLLDYARFLAKMVGANPAVSVEQREQLGLHIPKQRSPQQIPTNVPDIDVKEVTSTGVTIRVHNGDALVRRMPPDVMGMVVWTYLGDLPPLDVRAWTCQGPYTRPTATIDFGLEAASATRAWVAVAWFNRHGSGPMSLPTDVTLGGLPLSTEVAQQLAQQQQQQLDGDAPLAQAA